MAAQEKKALAKLASAGTRKGTRHWDYGDTWDPTIEKKALDPRRVFDPAKEADTFVAEVLPAISNVYEAFGEETSQGLGVAWNLHDPAVTSDLLHRSDRLRGTVETTWLKVQVAIADGEIAGESIDGIAKRIGRVFTQAKGYRARMIARTETIGAANAGSFRGAKASGVVGHKVWLAAIDHRTRSSHVSADGQKVALDGKFSVGISQMDYPGDPSGGAAEVINCRCTMLYERAVSDVSAPDAPTEITPVPTEAATGTPEAPRPATGPGNKPAASHLPERVTKPVRRKWNRATRQYEDTGGDPIGPGTKVQKGVNAGRKRIEEVHSAPPDMPAIPLQQTSGERKLGSYEFTRSGKPVAINVSSAKNSQSSVFAHEFGHYFDHQDFGSAGTFSSEEAARGVPDAILKEWWDAVEKSDAITTLRSLTGKDAARLTHVMADGRVIEIRTDYDFVRYLLDPREIWARSYAQWIATETGDASMLAELQGTFNGPYPAQWTDEDFSAVAKAFRKVFKSAGLIE